MCTGAVSPSSARTAGQDAMADASEAQEAGIAHFSEGLLVGSGKGNGRWIIARWCRRLHQVLHR